MIVKGEYTKIIDGKNLISTIVDLLQITDAYGWRFERCTTLKKERKEHVGRMSEENV